MCPLINFLNTLLRGASGLRTMLVGTVLSALLIVCGCTHDVRFPRHSPYTAHTIINAPLTIVMPDDTYTVYEYTEMGAPLDRMDYRIFYGEALAVESVARFRQMFSEIAIATETEYALATNAPLNPPVEKKARKDWEESLPSVKEKVEFLPDHVFDGTGYLMRFDRMSFSFTDDRPVFVAHVNVANREADALILEGRIRGTGRTVPRRQDVKLMNQDIRESVVGACTQMTLNLSRDLAEAIRLNPEG